jgi:hypothetical protein
MEFRAMKVLFFLMLLVAFPAVSTATSCPEGDLNGDCKVNLLDLAITADSWLEEEPNLPLGTVLINEVMAHSHATASDWIELYNTSGVTVDISGWYLSDSDSPLTKYPIPNGTTIAPHGYIVFYEDTHFGVYHGNNVVFALSENGETVYLSFPDITTNPRHVCDDRKFGASQTGVSLGRYTTSTGDVKFVAMDSNTPGQSNSYPKVGPIVITEIMYDPNAGTDAEYIELHNIENYSVNLYVYDPCVPADVNWAFTEGPEFEFPYHTSIPANGYLIVARDTDAFDSAYGDVGVDVLGPFGDGTKLSNDGENVEISMPGDLEDPNDVNGPHAYVRIDNVRYSDGSQHKDFPGLDPWPKGPDEAEGESLQRINPLLYGDDVVNWEADDATPGE